MWVTSSPKLRGAIFLLQEDILSLLGRERRGGGREREGKREK
jgi:hypothetical protein